MIVRRGLIVLSIAACATFVVACNDNGDGGGQQANCEGSEAWIDGACCLDADHDGSCDANTGGDIEEGGACDKSADCKGDLVCDPDSSVCAPDATNGGGGDAEEGDACDKSADCKGDLVCDPDSSVCAPDATDSCDGGQVEIGGDCCDDANDNGVCDDDETAASCTSDQIFDDDTQMCCDDLDDDGLCDDDAADDCVGADNGNDADGDGYCADTDCDDANDLVYPGAPEICGLQYVNDCDNSCWDGGDCTDAATWHMAKLAGDGHVGLHDLTTSPASWSDVTDQITDAQQVVPDGKAELFFCGFTNALQAPIVASGSNVDLHIGSGAPASNTIPDEVRSGADKPTVLVSDGATVSLSRVKLRHFKTGGSNDLPLGSGLKCTKATVQIIGSTWLRRNESDKGAGLDAVDCDITVVKGQELNVINNQAKQGAGLYLDHSTLTAQPTAEIKVQDNTTGGPDSAAVHITNSSVVKLQGKDDFSNNFGGPTPQQRGWAFRISDGSTIETNATHIMNIGANNIVTDANAYQSSGGYPFGPIVCDDTICTSH